MEDRAQREEKKDRVHAISVLAGAGSVSEATFATSPFPAFRFFQKKNAPIPSPMTMRGTNTAAAMAPPEVFPGVGAAIGCGFWRVGAQVTHAEPPLAHVPAGQGMQLTNDPLL